MCNAYSIGQRTNQLVSIPSTPMFIMDCHFLALSGPACMKPEQWAKCVALVQCQSTSYLQNCNMPHIVHNHAHSVPETDTLLLQWREQICHFWSAEKCLTAYALVHTAVYISVCALSLLGSSCAYQGLCMHESSTSRPLHM